MCTGCGRPERERIHRGSVGSGQEAVHVLRDAGRVVPAARVRLSRGPRGRSTSARLPAASRRPPPLRADSERPAIGARRRRVVGASAGVDGGGSRRSVAGTAERQQRGAGRRRRRRRAGEQSTATRLQTVFTGHERRRNAATSSVRR